MGSVPNSLFRRGSLWDNDLVWGHQAKCDSANPLHWNQLYSNECNNNSMKLKSSTWDFPVIGDKHEKVEEDKENLNWIPSMIQSLTVSFSNLNKNNNFGDGKYIPESDDVTVPLNENGILSAETDSKIGTAAVLEEDRVIYSNVDLDQDVSEDTEGEEDSTQVVPQVMVDRSETGAAVAVEKSNEADTLQTFLSKFDDKVAAIWGSTQSFDSLGSIRKNPWNSNNGKGSNVCSSLQTFEDSIAFDDSSQKVHQSHVGYPGLPQTACKVYASLAPSVQSDDSGLGRENGVNTPFLQSLDPDYFIVRKESADGGESSLQLLNHSDEASGFIRFVPEKSIEHDHNKEKATVINMLDDSDEDDSNIHQLDLECDEEQEIIEACWKGHDLMDTADESADLLTSWKTHFRTVIAQEVLLNENYDNGELSPYFIQNAPLLPEFRTDYEDDDYVLFRGSTAATFPLRFKISHENEKGNQTDDHYFDSYEGFRTRSMTSSGMASSQFGDWSAANKYGDPYSSFLDMDFLENPGGSTYEEVFYDDPSYDDGLDTFAYLNDSDYDLQFQYYWNPDFIGSKQKARRSKTKARPCKYFFLDGSCRRGDDCKFSHSLITCRFWAEGSCLKGDACPFLHCFLDEKYFTSEGLSDDCKEPTKYQLESESDFPSLECTKVSSRVPIEGATKSIDILSPLNEHRIENMESQFDERDASGWPRLPGNSPSTNWIYSLITVNEKRKKKKH